MLQIASLNVEKGRALKSEIGAAWITSSPDLGAPGMLASAGGAAAWLPLYRSAAQQAGGHENFSTAIADDGTLAIFLEAGAAEGMPADGGTGSPIVDGASYALVIDASGAGRRFPLRAERQGAIVALKARFADDDLKHVRAALFDANPNVAVEVTQPVTLALRQTSDFIERNWANETVRAGLLAQFGGIPLASAASYYRMASSADPDFPNQYLVLDCQYRMTVGVPPLPGYIQYQISWNGRAYNYYQDNRERSHVFFVPDSFEFASGPGGAPTVSLLQFSVPEGASSESDMRATFRYFGNPVVDQGRLDQAARALRDMTGLQVQMMSIEDGHDIRKTFTQYLPNAQASSESGNPQAQPNATIDLVQGLRNELCLNLAQFRALWAAIFSDAPEKTLFRGWVDVGIADGRYADRIDFNGRLPKASQTAFLDDILDVSSTNTYPADFRIKTVPRMFQDAPAILEIELNFGGKQQVTLDPDKTSAAISIERPIRDLILGNQAPGEYPYRMRVVREDGSMLCGNFSANSGDATLWIMPPMLDKCSPCQ